MTQDDIIEMVRKAGYMPINDYYTNGTVKAFSESQIERFANFAASAEREACAKLVNDIEARCVGKDVDDPPLSHVAAAIRARSES